MVKTYTESRALESEQGRRATGKRPFRPAGAAESTYQETRREGPLSRIPA